jgi:hypothetical protein
VAFQAFGEEKAILGWERRLDPVQSISIDRSIAIIDKRSTLRGGSGSSGQQGLGI